MLQAELQKLVMDLVLFDGVWKSKDRKNDEPEPTCNLEI